MRGELAGTWQGTVTNRVGPPSDYDALTLTILADDTFTGLLVHRTQQKEEQFTLQGTIAPGGRVAFQRSNAETETGEGYLFVSSADHLMGRLEIGPRGSLTTALMVDLPRQDGPRQSLR